MIDENYENSRIGEQKGSVLEEWILSMVSVYAGRPKVIVRHIVASSWMLKLFDTSFLVCCGQIRTGMTFNF